MSTKVKCSNQGEKVDNLISRLNPSLAGVVLCYLFEKGMENIRSITQEDLNRIEGNALMTADCAKEVVTTARLIALNCDLYEDVFPYIVHKLPNYFGDAQPVTLKRENLEACWEELGQAFSAVDVISKTEVEWDEIEELSFSVVLNKAKIDEIIQ